MSDLTSYTWNKGALPECSVTEPKDKTECYPAVETHTWGAFAGLAIELGGYGDLELIDPYSGRRFWCPVPDQIWEQGVFAAYHYLLEKAEAAGFTLPTDRD